MNKDLTKKCQSIEKTFVKNNSLDYSVLIAEVDKNSHFRTDGQHSNAVHYFLDKGIIIIENGKISKMNFNPDEINVIDELCKNAIDNYVDILTIDKCIKNNRIDFVINYLKQAGYKIEDDIYNDIDKDDFGIIAEEYTDDIEDDEIDESSKNNKDTSVYYNNDIVRQYLKDIGQFNLLTDEEEYKLATEYAKTKDIEIKNKLINCNLRLVVSIAKNYHNTTLSFMDIVQFGNMGLIEAVDRFDPSLGCKLSTYATYWIKQSIIRGLGNDGRTIRMPIHAVEQAIKNRNSKIELERKLNRTCTEEELVEYINDNKLFVSKSITSIDIYTLRLYENAFDGNMVSLSTPIGEEGDSYLVDFIPSEEPSPEDVAMKNALQDIMNDVINNCLKNEKEINVLKLRYGLDDGIPRTLEQVSKYFGVTRERIRQIEAKAFRRIRHSKYARQQLRGYNINL